MVNNIRTWTFVMMLLIPLCGFGAVARTYSGTLNISCTSESLGFQLTVQNAATGSAGAIHVPIGSCPGS